MLSHDVRDNEQVRSLHEGCEIFTLLLGDAIPDGQVSTDGWVCMQSQNVCPQFLGYSCVVELLIASYFSVDGKHLLDTLDTIVADNVVGRAGHNVDLSKKRVTSSSF